MKKYVVLNERGIFPAEKLAVFLGKIRSYSESDREALLSVISTLYSKAVEEGDSGCAQYFDDLTSKGFLSFSFDLKKLNELLKEDNPAARGMVSFLRQIKDENETNFNKSRDVLEYAVGVASEGNLEDFKECYKEGLQEPDFQNYYFFSDYVNPADGLFDRKIYDAAKEYNGKLQAKGREANPMFGDRSADIIKAAIDSSTGKISPLALDFADKYFIGIEDKSALGKLKSVRRSIKSRYSYSQTPMYKNTSGMLGRYVEILYAIKDSKMDFNPINAKYMAKILEMRTSSFIYNFEFFNNLKGSNGVVDESKFKLVYNVLEKTSDMSAAAEVAKSLKELGDGEAVNVLNAAEEVLGTERSAMRNFGGFVQYCWGDGEDKIENAVFIKEIVDLTDETINLIPQVFEVFQNEENKEFAYKLASSCDLHGYDINSLAILLAKYKDENGSPNPFIKDKIESFAKAGVPFCYFDELYTACVKNCENPEEGFLEDEFNKVTEIFGRDSSLCHGLDIKSLVSALDGDSSFLNLRFKEKVSLLNVFMGIKKDPETSIFEPEFTDKMIDMLDKSISNDSVFLPVSEEVKTDFLNSVLYSPKLNSEGYSEFETVLKESIPYLENLKEGLPLSYPRERFVKDLSNLCDSKEKIKILGEKTGIVPILKSGEENPEIEGYEGIILLDDLDRSDPFQNDLYNLMYKFMYNNAVRTGNAKLDTELNRVIKACPEFINIIGKAQHSTHNYSLDIHSLLVLAHSIENPEYLNLNSTDKVMLKIATLFHDIAKQQNAVDEGHQEPSSIYARSIVKKFFKNEDSKDRVYELIRNHHWLAEFQTSRDKEKVAKETAYKFRRPNDFEIAKIMARADLKAVSEEFYQNHIDALDEKNIKPISDMLDMLYATGCAAFTDYPDLEREFKGEIKIVNGREFKVINFNEIENGKNLFDYGFEYGKTKEDLNFLVHMVDEHRMSESLRTVDMLTSSVNGGVLSESIISPKYRRTYCNRKYGVLLSQINANLVNMNDSNQGSGDQKDFNDITRLTFDSFANSRRSNFRNGFLKELGLEADKVSDRDFGEFYKNHVVGKTSLSQFDEKRKYQIGKKTFSGKEIKEAIKKYQTSLIDVKEAGHNELVGYIPKIKAVVAKEKTISAVPSELLDFAYENNLPVVLV